MTSGSLLTMRGPYGNQKRTFNPLYDQIGETWKRSIGGDLISSKSFLKSERRTPLYTFLLRVPDSYAAER